MIRKKCNCGGTYIRDPRCRSWYCNKCYKHVKKLRADTPRKFSHNQSSLKSYYRRLGLKVGYLSVKQVIKFKDCTMEQLTEALYKFDLKFVNHRLKVIYNYKLIGWKDEA